MATQEIPEMRIRKVDNQEYLGMLKELILQGKEVTLLVAGSSMNPLLAHQRDSVLLGPVDREPRRGDIVFYQRWNGAYVLHRILRVCGDGTYDIIGDAQTDVEHGIRRDQIFSIVKKVNRKGKWIGPGMFWWWFFSTVWLRVIPLRRGIMRLYGVFAGRKE